MNRSAKFILTVLWLVFAAHVYALIWSKNLDVFPQLPEWVGVRIVCLTGLHGSEDSEQLTVYYMLIVSFVAVSLLSAVAILVWKGGSKVISIR
ncbi:hypothetical protein [Noviherbaspirillum sp. Root189]|uniref:hypothetical protein n=1 Tax=Noviherbaspirillum sp. Root189 TaxID=1736487 RepID=UPI00070EB897|nr:hypothetical protein [Noviherbaspirillum sp. Root189]KRB92893.1 hypothetical protein ASE07_14800 [Noviherbaspirillum sp. Root189]